MFGFALLTTSCEDGSVSSALVGVLALPLPFGPAASNRGSQSLSSLTRSQKSMCDKLLTALRWYP